MVPIMTMISQVVGHLSATPTWLAFCQLAKFLHNFVIIGFASLVAIGTAVQVHHLAGLPFT